jgi:hypothetical protein
VGSLPRTFGPVEIELKRRGNSVEHVTLLKQLQLPHWMIIVGMAFVVLGVIGIVVLRTAD